jgi:serine/threonine protein kinase
MQACSLRDERGKHPLANRPGDKFGPYRLIKLLGRGGMGEVWRATDADASYTGPDVALKIMMASVDEIGLSVRREIEASRRLQHDRICRLVDFGSVKGKDYLAYEVLDGCDLTDVLDDTEGGLPLAQAAPIALDILAGLAHAHAQRVYHRDLKPPNVRVLSSGRAKIMDFGIAKVRTMTRSVTMHLDEAPNRIGTPPYMAPEQLEGEGDDFGKIDGRTDLYALGIMLFEMLTGALPFRGSDKELFGQHFFAEPPPLVGHVAGIPDAVEEIYQRLLAKKKEDRFETAAAATAALRAALDGLVPLPPPEAAPAANPFRPPSAVRPAAAFAEPLPGASGTMPLAPSTQPVAPPTQPLAPPTQPVALPTQPIAPSTRTVVPMPRTVEPPTRAVPPPAQPGVPATGAVPPPAEPLVPATRVVPPPPAIPPTRVVAPTQVVPQPDAATGAEAAPPTRQVAPPPTSVVTPPAAVPGSAPSGANEGATCLPTGAAVSASAPPASATASPTAPQRWIFRYVAAGVPRALHVHVGTRATFGRQRKPEGGTWESVPSFVLRYLPAGDRAMDGQTRQQISRTHFAVELRGAYALISDHSSRGTLCNGARLTRGQQTPLAHGAQLLVAEGPLGFTAGLHPGADPSTPGALHLMRTGNGPEHGYLLLAGFASVGSGPGAALALDAGLGVAPHHAWLAAQPDGSIAIAAAGDGPVAVNGHLLAPGVFATIPPGAHLSFGAAAARLDRLAPDSPEVLT